MSLYVKKHLETYPPETLDVRSMRILLERLDIEERELNAIMTLPLELLVKGEREDLLEVPKVRLQLIDAINAKLKEPREDAG